MSEKIQKIEKSEEEWRGELGEEVYEICRGKGTERAFTGEYWNEHAAGIYHCRACGLELFSSETKFDSGTGWPSFFQPIAPERVETHSDRSWLMDRTEVLCARCGCHLGHVFDDGPKPTGLRYCMNSASLKLERK
jgi:peptide-methionine (R)-S-oxide reductase